MPRNQPGRIIKPPNWAFYAPTPPVAAPMWVASMRSSNCVNRRWEDAQISSPAVQVRAAIGFVATRDSRPEPRRVPSNIGDIHSPRRPDHRAGRTMARGTAARPNLLGLPRCAANRRRPPRPARRGRPDRSELASARAICHYARAEKMAPYYR